MKNKRAIVASAGRLVQVLSAAQIREQPPIEGHFLQQELVASVGEREMFGEPDFYDPRLGEHFVLRLSSRGLAPRDRTPH